MARAPKSYSITIANTGAVIACRADETILHAAVLAGIDYPYTCGSGNCGACVSLPRDQAKAGRTLACRARPKSDVTITWLGRGRR